MLSKTWDTANESFWTLFRIDSWRMEQILVKGVQRSIPEISLMQTNSNTKKALISTFFEQLVSFCSRGNIDSCTFNWTQTHETFTVKFYKKNNIFPNSMYSIFQKSLNPTPESPWFLLFIPCPSISFCFLFTGFLSRSCWHAPVAWSVSPCLLHDDCTSHWSFHPPWVCTGTTVT